MSAALESALHQCITQLGVDKTYWVAFSGGIDSLVLLTLCHQLRQHRPLKLSAIYINHGLHPHASVWSAHCKKVCETNKINFLERFVHVDSTKGCGMEEAARAERYRVFAEYMNKDSVLLTGHHQDDQAETVLLQLARGAGLKGLSAMPVVKPFVGGQHARPLLAFSRSELEQYASERQLQWVDDDSNANTTILRNFVRHDVMPLLKTRWPAVVTTLTRSAMHCAEAQVLLEEYALDDCKKSAGSRKDTLSVQALLALSPARARQVLRVWIQAQGFGLPDTRKMATILQDVLTAAWDRAPCVEWEGVELRRSRDDLYLLAPLMNANVGCEFSWQLSQPLLLPNVGTLNAIACKGRGLNGRLQHVTVRFRQGGESLCLPKRGNHTLKNLFQEWEVLPWLRDRTPLLFVEDRLVGVVGHAFDPAFMTKSDEMGWEIEFRTS